MGKKKIMKLPFLSQSKSLDPKELSSSSPPWPFPSCGNTKTLSFRAKDETTFRTFNSAFLEPDVVTPPESFFTISSSSRSFSTFSEDSGDQVESVIRGLRSDRLFFEPERSSSLLLREQEQEQEQEVEITTSDGEQEVVAYKESELLSMDSNNPYEDFKKSMEEMVQAHGLKDWQGLEELLGCYLKINGKNNHGYIVGAFIDLLVSLSFASFDASTSSTSTTTITNSTTSTSYSNYSSPSSPLSLPSSSITTPCLSSSILDHGDGDGDGDGIVHDDDDDDGFDEHDDDDDHVSS